MIGAAASEVRDPSRRTDQPQAGSRREARRDRVNSFAFQSAWRGNNYALLIPRIRRSRCSREVGTLIIQPVRQMSVALQRRNRRHHPEP